MWRRPRRRNGKAGLDFLVNQGCEIIVVRASRLPDKLLRYAAHSTLVISVNRYIASMANRCIWLENRSAAGKRPDISRRTGIGALPAVATSDAIIDRQERLDGYRMRRWKNMVFLRPSLGD